MAEVDAEGGGSPEAPDALPPEVLPLPAEPPTTAPFTFDSSAVEVPEEVTAPKRPARSRPSARRVRAEEPKPSLYPAPAAEDP